MTDKTKKVLILVYKILLSVSIVAAGLCLIYGCLSIYYSGDKPYSRDAVTAVFSTICIPVYICLGLVVISLISGLFTDSEGKKIKAGLTNKDRLALLLKKRDLSQASESQLKAINKERNLRRIISSMEAGAVTALCIAFLVYALDGSHYHQSEINSSMIAAMWELIPRLVLMLIVSTVAIILREKSCKRELEQVKALPSLTASDTEDTYTGYDKTVTVVRCVLLAVGIAVTVYGFATGGVADVLTKAVNICTECIGLG